MTMPDPTPSVPTVGEARARLDATAEALGEALKGSALVPGSEVWQARAAYYKAADTYRDALVAAVRAETVRECEDAVEGLSLSPEDLQNLREIRMSGMMDMAQAQASRATLDRLLAALDAVRAGGTA